MDKQLILHADDAGYKEHIDHAILNSLKQNIVQSCSVLMDNFPDKFLFKVRDFDYDVGLHFNSPKTDFLYHMDAQYKYMAKRDVIPTHIDSHGGAIFVIPDIARAYIEYGEYRNTPILVPKAKEDTIARFQSLGLNLSGFDNYHGFRIDDFYVLSMLGGDSYEEKKYKFLYLLDNVQPGITQIVLHISSNPDWKKWYWEWKLFEDKDVLNKLEEFDLTNWKKINGK